jgi:hypothetical protein
MKPLIMAMTPAVSTAARILLPSKEDAIALPLPHDLFAPDNSLGTAGIQ